MTLTVEEFNAISHYTSHTKLDQSFDIRHDNETDEDYFVDYDDHSKIHSVKWGLEEINNAMAYPFEHDVSDEEADILRSLFERYGIQVAC